MARDLVEIRFHLDQRIEEYVRNGMTLDEARQEAQRRLGNQTVVRDLTYGPHTLRWLADFIQDTRYAVRTFVWKERTRAFDDLSAARFGRADLFEDADTEQIPAAHVSAELFKLFGAPVVEGRTFTAAEDRPDGDPVVVLSYGFWQRHFGGEGRAIGKVLVVDQIRVARP